GGPQQLGEHLQSVLVVVDEEDAPAARRPADGAAAMPGGRGGLHPFRSRQADGEYAPLAGARALSAHAAAMELDQAAHQGEPDAESTVAPIHGLAALHEEVEDARQQVRINAVSVVAHLDDDLAQLIARVTRDVSFRRRVLRR